MNKVIKFFEKLGEIGRNPFAVIKALFENDKTGGWVMGVAVALIFSSLLIPLIHRTGFSWIIVVLTYVFIICYNGIGYYMLPTGDESRGEAPIRKATKILKWIGILVFAIALGVAWYLRIGTTMLLFATTAMFIYLVAPTVYEWALNRLKM